MAKFALKRSNYIGTRIHHCRMKIKRSGMSLGRLWLDLYDAVGDEGMLYVIVGTLTLSYWLLNLLSL